MDIEEFLKFLKETGWKEYLDMFNDKALNFYKYFETNFKCNGNEDKPGIQVVLHIYSKDKLENIEIALRGGLKDGTWIVFHIWNLQNKDKEEILEIVSKLVKSWEFINTI